MPSEDNFRTQGRLVSREDNWRILSLALPVARLKICSVFFHWRCNGLSKLGDNPYLLHIICDLISIHGYLARILHRTFQSVFVSFYSRVYCIFYEPPWQDPNDTLHAVLNLLAPPIRCNSRMCLHRSDRLKKIFWPTLHFYKFSSSWMRFVCRFKPYSSTCFHVRPINCLCMTVWWKYLPPIQNILHNSLAHGDIFKILWIWTNITGTSSTANTPSASSAYLWKQANRQPNEYKKHRNFGNSINIERSSRGK